MIFMTIDGFCCRIELAEKCRFALIFSFCLIHTRDAELRKALEKTKKKKRKLSAGQQEAPSRPLTSKPGRPPGVRNYTKRPKVLELGIVTMRMSYVQNLKHVVMQGRSPIPNKHIAIIC